MFSSARIRFFLIFTLFVLSWLIILPEKFSLPIPLTDSSFDFGLPKTNFKLKQGLDIQGGTQVVLEADMTQIAEVDRQTALESAREVILRRVDLYGVNEPVVQTAINGESYRLIVELAGLNDPQEALRLVGTTANLEFMLLNQEVISVTDSAEVMLSPFLSTGITGKDLKRAGVDFNPQTGQPVVSLEFNPEGVKKFATVTSENVGEQLFIILDDSVLINPVINAPIIDGNTIIEGQFPLEVAKNISIQLNAGALPVPIEVLEQKSIGASLGQASVQRSVQAGLIGVVLVMIFMILIYGWSGVIATLALLMYGVFTLAVYKLMQVTLTLPGIAGFLLSVGMAVDANILIFERMKEELRAGKPFELAMELGFGRAWDSIKDANIATIFTAIILINPFNLAFLNSSGLVRGFGLTLLIGVLISLFTGIVVTRTLMRLFLKELNN